MTLGFVELFEVDVTTKTTLFTHTYRVPKHDLLRLGICVGELDFAMA